jgi:hypothetical protein
MQTIKVDSYEPIRTPIQRSAVLGTTAINLGDSDHITDKVDTKWELWCSVAWLVGDSAGQLREVAAGDAYYVPSCSLSGTYAKVGSGTPTLVATGYKKAAT